MPTLNIGINTGQPRRVAPTVCDKTSFFNSPRISTFDIYLLSVFCGSGQYGTFIGKEATLNSAVFLFECSKTTRDPIYKPRVPPTHHVFL